MRLNLQQGLNQLRIKALRSTLPRPRRQLVDVLAIDALADLRSYLDELLVRTEVAQLDILWEEKVERVREIDDLLSQQREAVRDVERSFKHLVEP